MYKQDYVNLFNQMFPDWFTKDYIKALDSKEYFEEMMLNLDDFERNNHLFSFDENVTFGYFDGELKELLAAVEQVDANWQRFFTNDSRIYCAYINGEIASFCFEEDFHTHTIDNKTFKIAGPACVGTVPKYRRKGIGLAMIANVTENLKNQGYDISYIHYTGVANWYKKLGYETTVKWNKNGIII